ncbi:hypothetical protein [Rossellomorea marisflavi]|uniref:hypothetical protein n=1 Tax=Rossellomorea marisflavi TaxID=189381 RepID=UPI003F9F8C90
MLTDEEKGLLREFFEVVNKMKSANIIRSDRFLGDIGEFIISKELNVKLESNLRNEGFDATLKDKKYEIKYANGSKTNVSVSAEADYEYLVVLVGGDSKLSKNKVSGTFDVFLIPKENILKEANKGNKNYSFGMTLLRDEFLKKSFDLLT